MLILTIRTDKPEAEIGLFDGTKKLAYETWLAHRQLAETIHHKISELLASRDLTWEHVEGIVCFKGPGSFTGLRIGLSVSNALSASLNIPIISSHGDKWVVSGIKRLLAGENDKIALAEYGSPVYTTKPKN